MNGERRYSTKDIVTGVLLVVCVLAIAAAGVQYIRAGNFWKKRMEILVVFENVGSLTKDSPVHYNGVEKGRVKALRTLHLDAALIEARFPVLTPRDLDNLPVRTDALKRDLLALPAKSFDAACRRELVGTTMIELDLELLDENDPIRYHPNDNIRIVSTIFGDSAVEIISGSDIVTTQPAKPRNYIIGDSGDFESNLLKTMGEMKKILSDVKEVVGNDERSSFSRAQRRYAPINDKAAGMVKVAPDRAKHTVERFSVLAKTAKDRLNKTAKVLESLLPAAETATNSVQAALKDIQAKTVQAEEDAQEAMSDISHDITDTRDALKVPIAAFNDAVNSTQLGLLKAKADVEKAPARLATAMDAAGSMQSQSTDDMRRFSESAKKIMFNLKIAGFVAKEHKDLMLSNRDTGENLAQTALDIRRKLAMVSRRMTNAGADTIEAVHSLENDPAVDTVIDPVKDRADVAVKRLQAIRDDLDSVLNQMDATMYVPWNERKRAAWFGDGPVRWP